MDGKSDGTPMKLVVRSEPRVNREISVLVTRESQEPREVRVVVEKTPPPDAYDSRALHIKEALDETLRRCQALRKFAELHPVADEIKALVAKYRKSLLENSGR